MFTKFQVDIINLRTPAAPRTRRRILLSSTVCLRVYSDNHSQVFGSQMFFFEHLAWEANESHFSCQILLESLKPLLPTLIRDGIGVGVGL